MPNATATSSPSPNSPDYTALIKFLVVPFLESPESLSVDCEKSNGSAKVWIRVAFEAEDKGRVFGRGGRNIQAIRTVVQAAALNAGQSVHLDIFGGGGTPNRGAPDEGRQEVRREAPRRTQPPKPVFKSGS